ncbi:MAG: hypothetical protein RL226_1208 [Bacteroidota bacterium]|jgi:Spy/CpxP family protein refolding chaperone
MNKLAALPLLLFTLLSVTLAAQPGPPRDKEKLKQLKIAFLTEELSLTTDEAQKFWPVYNAFESERDRLEKEIRKSFKRLEETENPSKQEVLAVNELATKNRIAIARAEEEFVIEMVNILGPKKTIILIGSEEKFRRRVLEELRDRRRD